MCRDYTPARPSVNGPERRSWSRRFPALRETRAGSRLANERRGRQSGCDGFESIRARALRALPPRQAGRQRPQLRLLNVRTGKGRPKVPEVPGAPGAALHGVQRERRRRAALSDGPTHPLTAGQAASNRDPSLNRDPSGADRDQATKSRVSERVRGGRVLSPQSFALSTDSRRPIGSGS